MLSIVIRDENGNEVSKEDVARELETRRWDVQGLASARAQLASFADVLKEAQGAVWSQYTALRSVAESLGIKLGESPKRKGVSGSIDDLARAIRTHSPLLFRAIQRLEDLDEDE